MFHRYFLITNFESRRGLSPGGIRVTKISPVFQKVGRSRHVRYSSILKITSHTITVGFKDQLYGLPKFQLLLKLCKLFKSSKALCKTEDILANSCVVA